ncbi:hypothetical protein NP493_2054g00001 [Ridgeia piscesae]|uniref:Uncharacterized protein n=1 Tax=Ridgeia piscesae TaxID=27915 RepID=A0AAD9JM68_RIDPI|nr:hypothetical protein NP493_2054g00001 [Ridgeia piscesae]
MAAALRLRFLKPSSNAPLSSYYAIADLVIEGHCACFGHAGRCIGENDETCVCEHNTRGQHCEECLPLYNDREWRVGANQRANACEWYVGANTTAYNCSDWCIPCNCSLEGSLPHNSYSCDNFTGQCECDCVCKSNAEGVDCGQCKEYKLVRRAGHGELTSTISGIGLLEIPGGSTIQFVIEVPTTGTYEVVMRYESESEWPEIVMTIKAMGSTTTDHNCGGKTYRPQDTQRLTTALTSVTTSGVTVVGVTVVSQLWVMSVCVVGVTVVSQLWVMSVCVVGVTVVGVTVVGEVSQLWVMSVCVVGVTVVGVTVVSQLWVMSVCVVGVTVVGVTVVGEVSQLWVMSVCVVGVTVVGVTVVGEVSQLWVMSVCVVGVTVVSQLWVMSVCVVGVTVVSQLWVMSVCVVGVTVVGEVSQLWVTSVCVVGVTVVGDVCLASAVSYSFEVAVGVAAPSGGVLLLDSVLLLPSLSGLRVYEDADDVTQSAIQACYSLTRGINLAVRANLSCEDYGYSLMAELYGGALANVTLTGRRLCRAASLGFVTVTLMSLGGQYAVDNSCLDTGQCHCKPGVGGLNCDQCRDSFYALTFVGCTSCDCNPEGSTVSVCDKNTGRCSCKTRTLGRRCDQCAAGHSSNCSSSPLWYRSVYRSYWDLLTGPTAMQDRWTAVSGSGQSVTVKALTKITPVEAETVLRITNNDAILAEKDVFFVATQPFLGNKHGSYGQSFSFVIQLTDPTSEVDVMSENNTWNAIDRETGDIVLVGRYTRFTLVANISDVADGKKHSFTVSYN